MLKNTKLNNYFMKPTAMSNGLILYPINIYDYEEFRQLAMEHIVLDIKSLNNLNRQKFLKDRKTGVIPRNSVFSSIQYDNLFNYLTNLININKEQIEQIEIISQLSYEEKEILRDRYEHDEQVEQLIFLAENKNYQNILEEVSRLIIYATKGSPYFTGSSFLIYIDNQTFTIDESNFYEFRKIVMEQNLLFEPRIAPDPTSQQKIDREIKKKCNTDECDIEAMISFVTVNSGLDVSNYTYYRLRADYEQIMRTISYKSTTVYKANGCKSKDDQEIDYPNLVEHLSIKDSPYSKENLYRESKLTAFDKALQQK